MIYSKRPKSGRPAFGVFEKCPVPKPSGYRTVGSLTLKRSVFGISAFFISLDRFIYK